MQNIFKGLGIALITPFSSDGSVDYVTLGRLLDYQLKMVQISSVSWLLRVRPRL